MEEKPSLPIKTKIAAWWMMIILPPVLNGYFFYNLQIEGASPGAVPILMILFIFRVVISFIFFLTGIFIILRKKWAWDNFSFISYFVSFPFFRNDILGIL